MVQWLFFRVFDHLVPVRGKVNAIANKDILDNVSNVVAQNEVRKHMELQWLTQGFDLSSVEHLWDELKAKT